MLEYCSEALQKVSLNPVLFGKELRKSIKWLKNDDDDIVVLKTWCILSYGDQYPEIIRKAFKKAHH